MINAGTVAAFLTLDTGKFDKGIKGANAQLRALGDDNMRMRDKLKGVGGALSTIGTTMTTNVTLPLAGAGLAALGVAANFDEGMSKVAAISGATGNELDALRNKAREMGAKTKFSATEAASAFEYMAMAGWKTEEMMNGIEGIMNLAAASGEDLATTSDIVTDALTAFGLKAKDSGHFADILAAASSNANTNVGMMGETFKYVAPVAGALGISAEDTAEAIGLMANAGIKSSQAGTSLRSILTRLSTDAGASSKSLGALGILTQELGVDFYDANGKVRDFGDVLNDARKQWKTLSEEDASRFAKKIAGQEGISAWLAMMNAAPADIEKLSSAIANCDGTAEHMAETMQGNLKGQLTILKSQTEELAISVGTQLMPAAQSLVGTAQGIVDKFNRLDSGAKRMIVDAGLVTAAIGPTAIVLGKVNTGVSTLVTAVSGARAAFTAAGGGIMGFGAGLANLITPAGLVTVALAGVIAGGAALYKYFKVSTKGTEALGDAMKGAAKYADDFKSGLTISTGTIDDFASAMNAGFDLNDVETKIREVQGKITEIASKATSERRALTQSEIKEINKYYKELRELYQQEQEYYQSNLGALQTIVENNFDATAENTQKTLGKAQSYRDSAIESAEKAYEAEIAWINKTVDKDSEAYDKKLKKANETYNKQKQSANDGYAQIISTVVGAYTQQNVANSQFYSDLQQYNADVEAENQRHNKKILEIQRDFAGDAQTMSAALVTENRDHQRNLDEINQNMADSFDDNAQEIVGTLMAMLNELEKNDGKMTDETRQFATSFVACYDSLPADMRKTMDDTVEGMRRALERGKPKVLAVAKSIALGIPSVSRQTLQVQSPSRVMMAIGKHTTEGMELGMKQGKDSLYRTASEISTDTADVLAGISRARYDYQTPTTDYGDRLDRLLDAVERLTASEPVMQVDGRPFGRLVREYV